MSDKIKVPMKRLGEGTLLGPATFEGLDVNEAMDFEG